MGCKVLALNMLCVSEIIDSFLDSIVKESSILGSRFEIGRGVDSSTGSDICS